MKPHGIFFFGENMTGTLLIKNVWIADGRGTPLRKGACLMGQGGLIAAVESDFSACAAEKVIDGEKMILAPGFIDAHGHSDLSALSAPDCFSKISQGVTTEICGNCGLSAFPVTAQNKEHLQTLYENYGKEITWESCQEYLAEVQHVAAAISLVPLCGHNTLRAAVRGYEEGYASGSELDRMCALLEREFRAGAAGLSFGLLYSPGICASPGEIAALMKCAAVNSRICAAHLRSEGDELLESAAEMIELSLESGLKHFHFSHLKTAGNSNFGKLDKLLELFDEARSRGLEITCDRYPYTESMTQLSVSLPGAWKKMDDEALKKKLAFTEEKLRLMEELRQSKDFSYWERCRLVNTAHPRFAPFRGQMISAIPGDAVENVTELLAFDPVNCQASFGVMSEENMKRILALPFCVAGSDGNALPADGRFGHSHPRAFGAIARFMRFCLDMGLPIEECVSKVTGKSAAIFSLDDRGVIAPGKKGDLVLFDPDTIDCKADFLTPERCAEGIGPVISNGCVICN